MAQILIAIQARSTSTRLPGKSLEMIDKITMTEHVLRACKSTATHLNRTPHMTVKYCLLIPYGDALADEFDGKCDIVEGPEHDVLSRYMKAVNIYAPDYVVRITGDEPLSSPPLISKHIFAATKNNLDYTSNVYENIRTYIDGLDVEVISLELMQWLDENATKPIHREHVTTYFRENPPAWATVGSVISHIDLSHIKLSVDTKSDLEMVRENKANIAAKMQTAADLNHQIFRF